MAIIFMNVLVIVMFVVRLVHTDHREETLSFDTLEAALHVILNTRFDFKKRVDRWYLTFVPGGI